MMMEVPFCSASTAGFSASPDQSETFLAATGLLGPRSLGDVRRAAAYLLAGQEAGDIHTANRTFDVNAKRLLSLLGGILAAIAAHRAHLEGTGELEILRRARLKRRIVELVTEGIRNRMLAREDEVERMVDAVRKGEQGPRRAAEQILEEWQA